MRLEVVAADAMGEVTRAEIINLCARAYREDFNRLFDDLPGSVHVLARGESGVILSHAAYVTRWLQPGQHSVLRTAYVEAVATLPERQRQGLATAVLRHLSDVIGADSQWQLAALSPSDPLFYGRLGWELWRGPLAIRRGESIEPSPADEQVMIRRLPGTPAALDMASLLTAEWRGGELW